MRSLPSDPDIRTIIARIDTEDLDLQPEFQRGEVWTAVKKQRLIDTILRDWHVPPVHVIESADSHRQEVLDGQQRLAAIRDFVRGDFAVDGKIEPIDEEISRLDKLKYRDLPASWRRRFDQFTIRVFRIVDYSPSEPGELFFRLNQPTSLTAAEQRNAYFGPVRKQVKELVGHFVERGLDKEFLGFSNARMAYDDVLARVALAVERQSIAEKITSANLAHLYRGTHGLSEATFSRIRDAIGLLAESRERLGDRTAFNKATLFSWMVFIIRAASAGGEKLDPDTFADYLGEFEQQRVFIGLGEDRAFVKDGVWLLAPERLISIYEGRSASRVADVSSVLLRDAVLWSFFGAFLDWKGLSRPTWRKLSSAADEACGVTGSPFDEDVLARELLERGWGKLP